MKIKKDSISNLIVIINIIGCFFGYLYKNLYSLVLILALIDIFLIDKGTILLSKSTKKIIIIIIALFVQSFFSTNYNSSFYLIIMYLLILIIKVFLESSNLKAETFKNTIYFCTLIQTFCVILQYVFPFQIDSLNKVLLSNLNYKVNHQLLLNGSYAGITGQTGYAAFCITIFISFTLLKLFESNEGKKKICNIVMIIIGIGALLLTLKRSFLITISLSTAIILLISYKRNLSLRKVFLLIIALILAFILVNQFSILDGLIRKTDTLIGSNDITNGRLQLWQNSLSIFKNHFLIGIGFNTMENVLLYPTHNIYIQMLAETGIIGFIIFYFNLFSILISEIKFYRENYDNTILFSIFMQVIFLIYGFFGNTIYSAVFILPYFVFISIFEIRQKELKKNENCNINIF